MCGTIKFTKTFKCLLTVHGVSYAALATRTNIRTGGREGRQGGRFHLRRNSIHLSDARLGARKQSDWSENRIKSFGMSEACVNVAEQSMHVKAFKEI